MRASIQQNRKHLNASAGRSHLNASAGNATDRGGPQPLFCLCRPTGHLVGCCIKQDAPSGGGGGGESCKQGILTFIGVPATLQVFHSYESCFAV